jgi:hypothetical protein
MLSDVLVFVKLELQTFMVPLTYPKRLIEVDLPIRNVSGGKR